MADLLSVEGLRKDLEIVRAAVTRLHPGALRYQDAQGLESALGALERDWSRPRTLRQAYLDLSLFLATIRCGHTYANFFNQSDPVQDALFHQEDRLPFSFRWIEGKMTVTGDATHDGALPIGTVVAEVDGVTVREWAAALLPYVKGDGLRNEKRLADLEITGTGYEAGDLYGNLVFPPRGRFAELKVQRPDEEATQVIQVRRLGREVRARRLFPEGPPSADALWEYRDLEPELGYLRLGTFSTWNLKRDWKAFLSESLDKLRGKDAAILDLRGNEGGDDSVIYILAEFFARKPVSLAGMESRTRYRTFPADLRPFASSWSNAYLDLTARTEESGDGWFRLRGGMGMSISPTPKAYAGRLYLLVDAANSSATFTVARLCKQFDLATLVGRRTGGNLRGTNGSQIAFLRLPNSGLEFDLPLIGTFARDSQPDGGIEPDLPVAWTREDIVKGRDPDLTAVRKDLARRR